MLDRFIPDRSSPDRFILDRFIRHNTKLAARELRKTMTQGERRLRQRFKAVRSLLIFLCLSQIWGCTSNVRLLGTPVESNGLGLNSPYAETMPQVSRQFLTFVSDRNGSQDIYLWDISTRRLIPVPNLNRFDTIASNPSISEDGRYLAFSASQNDRVGIYIYDRTTQQIRRIGDNLRGETRHPHLSADGQRITFEVNQQGQWDVVVYSRSGQPLFGAVF